MCGIIGIIGRDWTTEALIRGRDAMIHRGPDDAGLEERAFPNGLRLGFGHRRLSILDLSSAGHQPMEDYDTGNLIVFNGEIYNHLEIRSVLPGQKWRSTSDTETLLAAYRQWGESALERTVGMFAIAIWDAANKQLFLARDRLGIKPIYFRESDEGFCFASEVRALLSAQFVEPRLDPAAVESYLAFGAVQEPHTIIKGVNLLPAGHWLRVGADGHICKRRGYWSLHDCFLKDGGAADIKGIRDTFFQAVKDRLISDVPLGAFLSGGIDSSAIVAAMSASGSHPPLTFCLDFAEGKYREGRFAELVAKKFGCHHHTVLVKPEAFVERLDQAFSQMDQPTCDGINSYFVSEVARQSGVTVALSGQGGDEVFAGYPSFRLTPRAAMLARQPASLRKALVTALSALPRLSARWLKLRDFLNDGPLDIYGAYAHQRGIFWDRLRRDLLTFQPLNLTSAEWLRQAVPHEKLTLDPINQVSQLELSCYLRNILLRDLDVFSMAHSLEVRVPMLDHRLVNLMAGIPGGEKLNSQSNKPLLVAAMGKDLPSEIVNRPKGIFWFPWQEWLRRDLRTAVSATLGNAANCESVGIRPNSAWQYWEKFLNHDNSVSWLQPWTLYVLVHWAKLNQVSL
jgi:asparagine synthase (glutamine-hydrolysing)